MEGLFTLFMILYPVLAVILFISVQKKSAWKAIVSFLSLWSTLLTIILIIIDGWIPEEQTKALKDMMNDRYEIQYKGYQQDSIFIVTDTVFVKKE